MPAAPVSVDGAARVALVGLGNIGSHTAEHVGRMYPGVGEAVLVDPDAYDESNVKAQAIRGRDVGKPKVRVAADRMREIAPDLRVTEHEAAVEDLPIGCLRADVILAGLDSRRARQVVNELAWRLGVPWIDAGVRADGLLARVVVFAPGGDAACLECAWGEDDYAVLKQRNLCATPRAPAPAPAPAATGAASYLGAAAASFQAAECEKILGGRRDKALVGRELLVALESHTHRVTDCRWNPACRFDHETWEPIHAVPADPSVSELWSIAREHGCGGGGGGGAGGAVALRVAGRRFAMGLRCRRCMATQERVALASATQRVCPGCGGCMSLSGDLLRDRLDIGNLSRSLGARPVSALGIRAGDVVSVSSPTGRVYLEIGGTR